MIRIKIDTHPLSLNRLYPTSLSGRRFLSKEGSDFKKLVKLETIKALRSTDFTFNPDTHFLISEFYFYTPKMFTKAGKINKKKPDTTNCIKAVEDAIFETFGIDDCYNLDVKAEMNYSENPCIVVFIRKALLSSKIDTLLN